MNQTNKENSQQIKHEDNIEDESELTREKFFTALEIVSKADEEDEE